MSAAAYRLLDRAPEFSALGTKLVLYRLCITHREGEPVSSGIKAMARHMGLSKNTVKRALGELEAAGILCRIEGEMFLAVNTLLQVIEGGKGGSASDPPQEGKGGQPLTPGGSASDPQRGQPVTPIKAKQKEKGPSRTAILLEMRERCSDQEWSEYQRESFAEQKSREQRVLGNWLRQQERMTG